MEISPTQPEKAVVINSDGSVESVLISMINCPDRKRSVLTALRVIKEESRKQSERIGFCL